MLYRRDRFIIQDSFWAGGVIAYPTEAVWGLGCNPNNPTAVHRLLALKNRPVEKGVILITGDLNCVQPILESLPLEMRQRALNLWPGHITLLIPNSYCQVPEYIRGQHDTVAIRVSCHPFVRWFTRTVAPFIVSTSANSAGARSVSRTNRAEHDSSQ